MLEAIGRRGYECFGSDILAGQDFLSCAPLGGRFSWIVTNPPFYLAEKFIRRARELCPGGGFAFLLKSQYWHGQRSGLFKQIRPDAVLPLTWRPDFLFGAKSSAPTMDVGWSVWRHPYNATRTDFEPLWR